MAKISVIGSGGWGIALTILLHKNGHDLTIWSFDKKEAEEFYFLAMACAIMNGNDNIVTGIKEDIKQYKLTPYKF